MDIAVSHTQHTAKLIGSYAGDGIFIPNNNTFLHWEVQWTFIAAGYSQISLQSVSSLSLNFK
jgi:hypothetical protein